MLDAGKDVAAVLQGVEVSVATYLRWRNQYGGMKAELAKRLKFFEEENKRLKEPVVRDIRFGVLNCLASGRSQRVCRPSHFDKCACRFSSPS